MTSRPDVQQQSVMEKPINLDDVLVNEIGEFGCYQMRNLVLVSLPIIISAFVTGFVFSAASIPHRCRIAECGENNRSNKFHPDWILNAIPTANSGTGFASCNRFRAVTNGTLDSCPAYVFAPTKVDCNGEFVYAKDNTVVYDFNLGCQEWLRVLVGTVNGIGTLLVMPVTSYVSDTYGRKIAILINIFNLGLFGVIRSFSINYPMFIALELLQTSLGGGAFSASFILGTEMVGPRYRVLAGAVAGSSLVIGHMILGGVAYLIPSWRYMTMALFSPCFLLLAYYWILDDSVRWQLSKQKYAQAQKTLEKVAHVNKKQISEKSIIALLNPPIQTKTVVESKKSSTIAAIFQSSVLLRRVVTTPVWWLTAILVYYGLSINATSLSDTIHLNYVLTSAIEIPSKFIALMLLDRIGRKPTICGGFFFSAACNISLVFISQDLTTVRLVVYMLAKSGISLVLTSIYLYTSELYPTEFRHSLLAFSSMIGRLGSVIAPLTPALMEYWVGTPSVIFGAMAVLSGLLVLTQPETLGTKLPDTLAEAEAIGKARTT